MKRTVTLVLALVVLEAIFGGLILFRSGYLIFGLLVAWLIAVPFLAVFIGTAMRRRDMTHGDANQRRRQPSSPTGSLDNLSPAAIHQRVYAADRRNG